MEIWIRREGQEYGPYTLGHVKGLVDNGEVTLEDEAWFDGCEDYGIVQDIPGLFAPQKVASPKQPGGKSSLRVVLILAVCLGGISALATGGYFILKSLKKKHTVTSIKMEMLYCRPGKFWMGSPEDGVRRDDETFHKVQLKQGFYLGKHEVTQAQWEIVMGSTQVGFQGAGRPVEKVSWDDATAFCRKLTEMEKEAGRLPEGWAYQLPTEAQWEYACRARSKSTWSFGGDASKLHLHGNYADSRQQNIVKWADSQHDDGHKNTAPVGSYRPNRWGFHDMHGNVWEWCRDFYGEYPTQPVRDPVGSATGSKRIVRGGGWVNKATFTRSAIRDGNMPSKRVNDIGFRCSFQPLQ